MTLPFKHRRRFALMVIVATCVLGPGQISFAQESPDSGAKGAIQIEGTVEPLRAADISPRFDGLLKTIHFQAGDYVKKGDLLFEFLTIDEELQLKIDRAGLDRAEAQLQLAEADLDRSRMLRERAVRSEADLQTAEAQRDIAKANADAARAQVDMRETTIWDYSLYAPFDGVISEPYTNEGAYITKAAAREASRLATVTQLDPIKVTGKIPFAIYAARRSYLPTGEAAKADVILSLVLPNGDEYPHEGKITAGGYEFDRETQRISISAVFPNPDLLLRPGLRVTVVLTPRSGEINSSGDTPAK